MSLADNKGKKFGLGRGVNKQRVDYYRELLRPLNLGLEDKMNVKVGSLSGGQRQAMALLMSTMTPIEFLILDDIRQPLTPRLQRDHYGTDRQNCEGKESDNHYGDTQPPLRSGIRKQTFDDASGRKRYRLRR